MSNDRDRLCSAVLDGVSSEFLTSLPANAIPDLLGAMTKVTRGAIMENAERLAKTLANRALAEGAEPTTPAELTRLATALAILDDAVENMEARRFIGEMEGDDAWLKDWIDRAKGIV